MFIQTEQTSNPDTMKFIPGREVMTSGTAHFPDRDSARRSPLAERLFEIEQVDGVFLGSDFITVTKRPDSEWHLLKPALLGAIMEHFVAGRPVVREAEVDDEIDADPADADIVDQIRELVDTRIRPAASQDGGDVRLKGYRDGVVVLAFEGSAKRLMRGIENILRHYVPEVTEVVDHLDAMPKPGLDTDTGRAIRQLLEERINPAVASHGGYISLVDVREDTAFIRLEGGCQGCGMADVTLKQGVEVEIKNAVPAIAHVYDVTDHANGANPYYQPR
ncbi:MAG: hypothetical protein CMM50_14180 [Rhodospirillaceae bacterium]|nr:hypothetical protein [Rhodospirillaceae bacterium]